MSIIIYKQKVPWPLKASFNYIAFIKSPDGKYYSKNINERELAELKEMTNMNFPLGKEIVLEDKYKTIEKKLGIDENES